MICRECGHKQEQHGQPVIINVGAAWQHGLKSACRHSYPLTKERCVCVGFVPKEGE